LFRNPEHTKANQTSERGVEPGADLQQLSWGGKQNVAYYVQT